MIPEEIKKTINTFPLPRKLSAVEKDIIEMVFYRGVIWVMKEREQADIESGPEAVLELERQMMKECFDHILKLSEDNKELHDAIKKKKDTMTK